jgi:hypothetical protein
MEIADFPPGIWFFLLFTGKTAWERKMFSQC